MFLKLAFLFLDLAENDNLIPCFKIEFIGPNNRSYTLGANTRESMEQWIQALKCASFSVKSIVANFENTIKPLDGKPVVLYYYLFGIIIN